ncbi:MAG TPA: stage II sporulation protein M [Acidobacteriota bacterium]|nr:stage II sporulation protein M [Acidobacteriota bacterium]
MLEELFKKYWIEYKSHAFFLGFFCVFIGTVFACFIMPRYVGIMSVAFTTLILTPSLQKLIVLEENKEIREQKFSFPQLLADHSELFKIYFFLFMGIFAAYVLLGAILPEQATQTYFGEQLQMTGILGAATQSSIGFKAILLNNISVLITCFVLSFFYGAGSILYLTLNASAWGIFFGYVFSSSSVNISTFLKEILLILPHTLIEALSYISIIIAGAVLSAGVIREKLGTKKFNHVLTDALIFFCFAVVVIVVAAFVEVI